MVDFFSRTYVGFHHNQLRNLYCNAIKHDLSLGVNKSSCHGAGLMSMIAYLAMPNAVELAHLIVFSGEE